MLHSDTSKDSESYSARFRALRRMGVWAGRGKHCNTLLFTAFGVRYAAAPMHFPKYTTRGPSSYWFHAVVKIPLTQDVKREKAQRIHMSGLVLSNEQ